MKKEELIEKYPNVLIEIMLDLIKKCNNKPELLNEVWNEYLKENKSKSDFQVNYIKILHHEPLWLNKKGTHFCDMYNTDIIEYEKALLIGDIKSVVYKNVQYSINDVVDYNGKLYEIKSFDKEKVNLKEKNGNYYYEPHISEIKKVKLLGITEDSFECYEGDNIHWIIFNQYNKWEYLNTSCTLSKNHFLKNGKLYNKKYKIFKLKENALKFIENNNPKVLFTTFDGVEIKEDDSFWVLYIDGNIGEWKAESTKSWLYKEKDGRLLFSSKKAAEDYKLKHSKVLSYSDISDSLDSDYSKEYLLNLVKERLNQK